MKVYMLSCFNYAQLCATLWTIALQGFSWDRTWSGFFATNATWEVPYESLEQAKLVYNERTQNSGDWFLGQEDPL